MVRHWLSIVTLGALLVAPAALAAPAVTETIVYYDIKGATPQDIRAQMRELGPTDFTEGKRYDANTRWNVSWKYNYANTGQGCSISTAYTTVKVTITIPRLQDVSAPAALKQSFDDYTKNLLVHEKGHGQTAIDIARKIEGRLVAMPPQPSCDRMGKAANELGNALIKEANQADIDYDARTQHGRTQGARFP